VKVIEINLNKLKNRERITELSKKRGIGEIKEGKIRMNILELIYLSEMDLLKLRNLDKLKSKFFEYYLVYKDLISKGFVVKTGLKYGFHFRVYKKEDYFNKGHSLYLVYVLKPNQNIESYCLISKFRVAHSVRKRVLFAFVDEEGSIIYYENKWLRI